MESDYLPPSSTLSHILLLFQLALSVQHVFVLLLLLFIIISLLVCSAIVSGSEVAFFSISPSQLQDLRASEAQKDIRIIKLLEKPRYLLATILISNNFINVSLILIFNYFLKFLFENIFNSPLNVEQYALLNALLLTPPLVFFGEVSPKVYATKNNLRVARLTSRFFTFLSKITYPIAFLLVKSGLFVEKHLVTKSAEIDYDELEKAIELSASDSNNEDDVQILKGIVHFGNTTVKQIMVPRVDIEGVKMTFTFKEVLQAVRETGYSRLPAYQESIDNVEGILYLKDLLQYVNEKETFAWQELLRNPFFVPETKKIDDLLREIQSNRKHQAIVVDEYGGTKGLVTLEDILEEVVGDINDEFDNDTDLEHKKINNNTYIFDGKINLEEFCEIINIDSEDFSKIKGESDTLAGLVLELLGEMPKKGSEVTFKNYTFKVLSLDRNRINKVKVSIA